MSILSTHLWLGCMHMVLLGQMVYAVHLFSVAGHDGVLMGVVGLVRLVSLMAMVRRSSLQQLGTLHMHNMILKICFMYPM